MSCNNGWNHDFEEEYYGIRCKNCGVFYPYGCEPWADNAPLLDDEDDDEYFNVDECYGEECYGEEE